LVIAPFFFFEFLILWPGKLVFNNFPLRPDESKELLNSSILPFFVDSLQDEKERILESGIRGIFSVGDS
jgi:hypothetical protein